MTWTMPPTQNFMLSAFTFTSIGGYALPYLTSVRAAASRYLEVTFHVHKKKVYFQYLYM
jgi:hypothetical protein